LGQGGHQDIPTGKGRIAVSSEAPGLRIPEGGHVNERGRGTKAGWRVNLKKGDD